MKLPWNWIKAFLLFPLYILVGGALFAALISMNPWLWGVTLVAGLILFCVVLWTAVRLLTSVEAHQFLQEVAEEADQKSSSSSGHAGSTSEADQEGRAEPDETLGSDSDQPSNETPWEKSEKVDRGDIAGFMGYLQNRMDFIAQATTSWPSWSLSLQWMKFQDFGNQQALLDNVARSHGMRREDIGLIFKPNPVQDLKWKDQEYDPKKNPSVDIPHGAIGAQAIYIILENIIRNAAKYGNTFNQDGNGDQEIDFVIELNREWAEEGNEREKRQERDFYCLRVRDDIYTRKKVAEDLRSYLSDPIIDPETAELQRGEWGMKEIKICASYLRMIKQEEIDRRYSELKNGNNEEPPVVQVFVDEDNTLTYDFYLLQQKEAIIVGKIDIDEDRFNAAGVDFYPDMEELENKIRQGKVLRHHFLIVLVSDIDWGWIRENRGFLPSRIIVTNDEERGVREEDWIVSTSRGVLFHDSDGGLSPIQLKNILWREWTDALYGQYSIFVRWNVEGSAQNGIAEFIKEGKNPNTSLSSVLAYDHADKEKNAGEGKSEIAVDLPKSKGFKLYEEAAFHECVNTEVSARGMITHMCNNIRENSRLDDRSLRAAYRLKEAAALSVAILDQRIYKDLGKPFNGPGAKYESADLETVWEKRRVHLLDIDDAKSNFSGFVNDLDPHDGDQYDFLVLHQGDMDEIIADMDENEFDNVWRKLEGKARTIVMETGRGQASLAEDKKLREGEYSGLAEAIFKGTKLDLASFLLSLRAKIELSRS